MKRKVRRKARRNPVDATTYWVALGALLVGGVAVWAWKNMSEAQQQKALPL